MTIASKLLELDAIKTNIKDAIIAKGISMSGVPFTDYATKIGDISSGGSTPIPEWVRPADWLPMPSFAPGEQKVAILNAVTDTDTNAVAFYISGACTVDWGDGTVINYPAFTTIEKVYNYASISNSTLSSRGYKQVLITITPQAGQLLAVLNLRMVHSVVKNLSNPIPRKFLDVIISAPYCDSLSLGDQSGHQFAVPLCERIEIKEIGDITNVTALCAYHYNLQKFSMPVKSSITQALYMFINCTSLREVSNANFTNATSTAYMFQDCSNLEKVTGAFDSSTNITQMFRLCTKLKEIDATFNSNIITCTSAFSGCQSLLAIPTFQLSNSCTSTGNLFENCSLIEEFPNLNLTGVTYASSMFLGCTSLKTISNLSFTASTVTIDSLFSGCVDLASVSFSACSASSMISTFQTCRSLQSISGLTTANCTSFANAFNGCVSLETVPNFNMSAATTASGTFFQCRSLANINAYEIAPNVTVADCALSSSALTTLYRNLSGPVTSKTLTVTNNFGAALTSKASCGTTVYSTTITQSNTSGLSVGQLVTGTGITTPMSVTTVGSTDRVNRYLHGLPNGKRVAFVTLTGTTGIAIKTIYYVVNADADGFQLSLTPGGAVIDLVNDGSGTITYPTFITGITTNTNFTVDVPATSTNTATLVARMDDASWATSRGWNVTS